MSCACELILLVYVALYVVRGVHTFPLCLLQTEQLANGDQRKVTVSVIEACVYERKRTFSPQSWAGDKKPYRRCQGQYCSRESTTVSGYKCFGKI